jgi:prolipoprotein diacylglyceryl transferase
MFRSIPTPTTSAYELGPFTIHAYALCIISGVAIAIWLSNKRFIAAFPAARSVVADVAILAVPAGVVGGRLYHVITSPDQYFGEEGHPLDALKIWNGGLGIWGAIALGALGAWIAYSRLSKRIELPAFRYFADAVAPGILLAQALGRWGNWFNAELFGGPTTLPWALEIPRYARPSQYKDVATFHPTFLYESLWCAAVALLIIYIGSRLRAGQSFALYVTLYCVGRLYFESLRVDPAHTFLGLRINIYISLLLGIGALITFLRISPSKR